MVASRGLTLAAHCWAPFSFSLQILTTPLDDSIHLNVQTYFGEQEGIDGSRGRSPADS